MWATIVAKLAGTLPETLVTYFKAKQKLKQELKLVKLRGKITRQEAKDERLASDQKFKQDWSMSYVRAQATSYKDEIVLATFLWPFWGVFVPGLQDYVLTGFEYLAKVPYWWVGLTVTLSLAIYGIRHKNAANISAPGLRDADVVKKENE